MTNTQVKHYSGDSRKYHIKSISYSTTALTYDVVTDARSGPPPIPTPYSGFDHKIQPTLPVSLANLGDHVAYCHSDTNAQFVDQFKVEYCKIMLLSLSNHYWCLL